MYFANLSKILFAISTRYVKQKHSLCSKSQDQGCNCKATIAMVLFPLPTSGCAGSWVPWCVFDALLQLL